MNARRASIVTLVLLVVCTASAQTLPAKLGVRILFKALSYDSKLESRCPQGLNIGVVVLKSSSRSVEEGTAINREIASVSDKRIKGLVIKGTLLELDSEDELAGMAKAHGVNTLYLSQGWSPGQCKKMLTLASSRGWLVMTGTVDHVKMGAALGAYPAEGKPKIAVNAKGALAQGAQFDSGLLSLAEVYR